jgi:hypothetical protein
MVVAAVYLACLSVALVFFPGAFMDVLGTRVDGDAWIRIAGSLLAALAFYYLMAVREQDRKFFRWTVYGRVPVIVFFAALVAWGVAPPLLLVFGIIESAGGIWTALAVRNENLHHYREMARL